MKKMIIVFLLLFMLTGCKEIDIVDDPVNDIVNEIGEPTEVADVINEMNSANVEYFIGFHSVFSSYLFVSENKSLINLICKNLRELKGYEVLTDENRDSSAHGGNKSITLYMEGHSLVVELTEARNIYLKYYRNAGETATLIWQYKCSGPSNYDFFTNFTLMGRNPYLYCENEVLIQTYPAFIDEYMQKVIVASFIEKFSDIADFYTKGAKFSGCISGFYGKYENKYAVMIDGCGIFYDEALWTDEIDGVRINYYNGNQIWIYDGDFHTLHEAYESGLITKHDLTLIAKLKNREEVRVSDFVDLSENFYSVRVRQKDDIYESDTLKTYLYKKGEIEELINALDYKLSIDYEKTEFTSSTTYDFFVGEQLCQSITIYDGCYIFFNGIRFKIDK